MRAAAARVPLLVVPEVNYGQMSREVERVAGGRAKTVLVPHAGGGIHTPEGILAAAKAELAAIADPAAARRTP